MSSTDQPTPAERDVFASANAYVNAMDGGEFLRRAGDLRELVKHPGYRFLEELIAVEAEGIRARSKAEDPLLLAARVAKDPAAAAVKLAAAGGEARGLERFEVFAQRMLQLAESVAAQINEEGAGS